VTPLRAAAGLAMMLLLAGVALATASTHAKPRHRPSCPGTCWIPSARKAEPWQWELSNPLSVSSATLLGTNSKTYTRRRAAAPVVYDIDGIENTAFTVAALHRRHDHVICYIEVGAAGNYGDAYTTYYNEYKAAGVLGTQMPGYPENYLNINSPKTVRIVETIIRNQCAAKHFDAVEPDIDDSWYDSTGFPISLNDEVRYLRKLSGYAHSLGLAWGLKDGDQADPVSRSVTFIKDLIHYRVINFALTEQSFQYGTASAIEPVFARAHLAWLDAEYDDQQSTVPPAKYCPYANRHNVNAVQFDSNLDGAWRVACR